MAQLEREEIWNQKFEREFGQRYKRASESMKRADWESLKWLIESGMSFGSSYTRQVGAPGDEF